MAIENLEQPEIEQPEVTEEAIDEVDEQEEQNDALPEAQEQETDESEEQETDEIVIEIEGEEKEEEEQDDRSAPQWVKELRKKTREQNKEIKRLKDELAASKPESKVPEVGKKPTLESCDYDEDKYESELNSYYERKRASEKREAEIQAEQEQQQKAWQNTLADYGTKKSQLKVSDYELAEEFVQDVFSEAQIGMIVSGADNSAKLLYALYRNPKKAKELAGIKDLSKFGFLASKVETKLVERPRKATTKPERKVSGNVDSTLERLRAEADKTGDMSKVVAYKRQMRQKSRA